MDGLIMAAQMILALSIIGLLDRPNLLYTMIAVSMAWWPWYTRLIYNITRSIKTEGYIAAAEIMGASKFHIMFREILPNCLPSLLTKITLDLGFVILVFLLLSHPTRNRMVFPKSPLKSAYAVPVS